MVTKKDLKAIADIIEVNTVNKTSMPVVHKLGLVKHLSEYFATQNPRFDRERFMIACGL